MGIVAPPSERVGDRALRPLPNQRLIAVTVGTLPAAVDEETVPMRIIVLIAGRRHDHDAGRPHTYRGRGIYRRGRTYRRGGRHINGSRTMDDKREWNGQRQADAHVKAHASLRGRDGSEKNR